VNALGHFLTRRPRGPKHGSGEQLMAAIATLPPDHPVHMPLPATAVPADLRRYAEAMHPQAPTFTPTARNLANARPFPAPASAAVRGAHARTTPRHVQQDDGTLRRVRDGLRDLPAAPLSRAEQFTADMRSPRKGGLPVFRQVAHKIGWCGLNEEYSVAVLSPRGAERLKHWEQDCLHVIAAQVKTARIEISGTLAELDRYEARLRAAADAALALGYPGEAL
jgi:hypothetical protein